MCEALKVRHVYLLSENALLNPLSLPFVLFFLFNLLRVKQWPKARPGWIMNLSKKQKFNLDTKCDMIYKCCVIWREKVLFEKWTRFPCFILIQ